MKRNIFIMTLLILVLAFNSIAFGANGIINVSMNGNSVNVKEVPIIMNGQAFKSDVPSFIHVDRTLVPIRFVAESFGAKVEWDQKTKTATVLHNEKVVKLTIDSDKVVTNNQTKNLDKNSIPKLVTFSNKDSRTMVPVRFISEVLGYEVGWDDVKKVPYINTSTNDEEVIDLNPGINPPKPPVNPTIPNQVTINSIKAVKGSTESHRVEIKSDAKIEYDTMFLPDSNKLVIDIKNAKLNIPGAIDAPGSFKVSDVNFKAMDYSQYTANPFVTRIVVTLNNPVDYEFVVSPDGKTTTLSFGNNQIKEITNGFIDNKEVLVIDGIKEETKINVIKLKNPERIVIDLLDSSLVGTTYKEFNYQIGYVKSVRVSQFIGDNNYKSSDRIVRIVLDVKDGITEPNIKIDTQDGMLLIYPEKNIWENISYEGSGIEKLLNITNLSRTRYSVDYNPNLKLMEIIIPSENSNLSEGLAFVQDGLVDEIEVIKNFEETKVLVRFNKGIEYNILSSDRDSVIRLSLKRDPNLISTDKVIVLDAGHGGNKPGAISPGGIREKDVNLQITLKAANALKALGYKVILTRSDDTDVDLYERANIANRNNADIFVSIHANSNVNSAIYGLEILYCPAYNSPLKTGDQYPLASTISKGIVNTTGVKDRGIFQRPGLVVLNKTNMPAVLVETGYLSNAEEVKLITNDAYQNKIVSGIVLGIQNYFEMY